MTQEWESHIAPLSLDMQAVDSAVKNCACSYPNHRFVVGLKFIRTLRALSDSFFSTSSKFRVHTSRKSTTAEIHFRPCKGYTSSDAVAERSFETHESQGTMTTSRYISIIMLQSR